MHKLKQMNRSSTNGDIFDANVKSIAQMKKNSIWRSFCGEPSLSSLQITKKIQSDIDDFFIDPFSCKNHIFTICVDLFIIILCICIILRKSATEARSSRESRWFLNSRLFSAIFNGSLSVMYLGFGFWALAEKLIWDQTVLPLHSWLVLLSQGFKWMMLCLTLIIKIHQDSQDVVMRLCSVANLLQAGFLFISSIWLAILVNGEVSAKMVLDILSLPASVLLLSSAFQEQTVAGVDPNDNVRSLREPLQVEGVRVSDQPETVDGDNVAPLA